MKIHLSTEGGTPCRYSARARKYAMNLNLLKINTLPLDEFLLRPKRQLCGECSAKAAAMREPK